MKLAGSHRLAHPRPVVWDALMDPAVLSRTLPGCERLETTGDGAFAGALTVAIGPVRGQFEGTLEMSDLQPPERYHMRLAGQGASGFLTGEGEVRLEEADGGAATVVHYDLDAQVGGRIAGVGQRLLDSSAKVIARQGLEGLERQLAARGTTSGGSAGAGTGDHEARPATTSDDGSASSSPEGAERLGSGDGEIHAGRSAAESTAPPAPAAPTSTAFAARFAQGLWQELVPPSARPWLLGAVAAAILVVVWLLTR
ncbi:MAG TPA: carbon monoxide dehydrogenase subunit G [Thermoanaerobaculia bacterium]|nr:carbon monoxide dehydrogenase subunit G [Thermoanaerobaculia bacterium]